MLESTVTSFLGENTMTTTTTTTLAARASALLSKVTAYAVAEKAMAQAIAARRVYPPMAEDFSVQLQLGYELPLKSKDFIKVVGNLLAASEKPLKGVVSKKKSEILGILAELVGVLSDTTPIPLPTWAMPKERTKKAEEPAIAGTLERANAAAEANDAAEAMAEAAMAKAKGDSALAKAVATVVASASALSDDQREALLLALASTEPA